MSLGHILDSIQALKAEGKARYSERHDSYYMINTGEWLEKRCDEPARECCQFCTDRPEKHIEGDE